MMKGRSNRPKFARVAPLLATSAVLLLLMGNSAMMRLSAADAEAYHKTVREAAGAMPMVFGSWLGVEVPVPRAAVKMLRPNIIFARRYHNIQTDETVMFLLVHVKDARDLLGHYPPVCYPAQGWKIERAEAQDWMQDRRSIRGTDYLFTRDAGVEQRVVSNFFIARGGVTCRDMDAVEMAARDRQRKFFGVAQVQLVYEQNAVSPQRRREIVEEFVGCMGPTLSAISSVGTAAEGTPATAGARTPTAEPTRITTSFAAGRRG